MDSPLRIAVVVGSTSERGVGATIAAWFERHAASALDPAPHPMLDPALELKLELVPIDVPAEVFGEAIGAADGVVVITPEYNHSFPGALKTAIDGVVQGWFAKPVGFVTYGGISGGLRAAEALRVVFGELHTVTIRETISFAHAADAFGSDGEPHDPAGTRAALTRFLQVLVWWARHLRQAVADDPYPATAPQRPAGPDG